jgi:hypothetical protein
VIFFCDLFETIFLEDFMLASYKKSLSTAFVVVFLLALCLHAYAQSGGSSGSINGTVVDPSGAVVANASVEIHNAVSGYDRTTTTDSKGNFSFPNVPFNPYHMKVTAVGFASYAQDVETRSVVPVSIKISLQVSGSSTTVTVESGGDLVEKDPTFHSDIGQTSPGKRFVVIEFAGYALDAGRRSGFQWTLPWDRRPRGEFVLRRRPADYRSAK